MIFGQEILHVLYMSQPMFELCIAVMVIVCSLRGIQEGRQKIKMTRDGLLPAAEPSKDNIVFLYTDAG